MDEYVKKMIKDKFLLEIITTAFSNTIRIPTDPSVSLRARFKEVILPDVFKTCLNKINQTEQQQSWLTDKQIHDLMDDILNQPFKSLAEANENVKGAW